MIKEKGGKENPVDYFYCTVFVVIGKK